MLTEDIKSDLPIVSICCQTYNQKNYITQAIEGFLMQKTNFLFEILLRDDASTDGTTEIVKKYAKEYPDRIKPLIYKENQFVKGVKPLVDNMKRAKGKYIAICEGDDYWTDPYKLQKQVDFLEENSEYGLVHTDNSIFYENSKKLVKSSKHNNRFIPPSGYVFKKLLLNNFLTTLTVVGRRDLLINVVKKLLSESVYIFDYSIWLEMARQTKVKYIDNDTGVYRVSDNTISRPASKTVFLKWINEIYLMKEYFLLHSDLDSDFVNRYRKRWVNGRLHAQYESRFFEKRFSYLPLHDMALSYSPYGFYDKLLHLMYKKSCGWYCYHILKYFHSILSKIKKQIIIYM